MMMTFRRKYQKPETYPRNPRKKYHPVVGDKNLTGSSEVP